MTTIAAGVLIVGGSNGSLGSGDIVDNGALVFYRSGTLTVTSTISGTGPIIVNSGTVILSGNNTYSGYTAIYGGTLLINGNNAGASTEVFGVFGGTLGGSGTLAGPVTLNAGTTLAPGASIGTLTINNNLSIGGKLAIEVNKSLSPSNDFVLVSGALTNTGTGTLTVSNLGPALAVGDKFTLFSEPVQNGAALTVTGAGATWANNLAADGSISVLPLVPAPILNYTNLGGTNLQFSWTGYFKLQSQTNNLDVGIGTNWGDYPGGGISGVNVPIDKTNESVFFRLAPVGQGQTLVYDQQSTTNDTDVPPLGATMYQQPLGQSFVPTFSSVGFARFSFSVVNVPDAVDATIYVNLWAESIATGTLLGSTASVFLPVGFSASTNFFFSSPVTVNPGTTYYFQPVAEIGSDYVNVGLTATGTAYTNGTAIFFGVPISSHDLWFREGIVAP
jgi:autotransporter-associated beta strand protein